MVVLILEDDRSNLNVFSIVLSSQGFEVLQATTDKEAIDLCKDRSQIDLFVCDVGLGAPSGTDVALQLRRVHAVAPVLFVSGMPMYAWAKRDMNNYLKLPVDFVDYLEKPFGPSALLAKVNQLLQKRSQWLPGRIAGDAS
jgi:DNA-binding response OmpR family regulator